MIYYIVCSMLLIMTVADILWKKIPNILIFTYLIIGIYILGFNFALRFFGFVCILAFLYSIRFFGAGDVKMVSLLIGFLDIYDGMYVIMLSLIFAAIYALLYMTVTHQLFERLFRFFDYCVRTLKTGKPEKYINFNSENKALMPLAPCFLAGFILWRCLC